MYYNHLSIGSYKLFLISIITNKKTLKRISYCSEPMTCVSDNTIVIKHMQINDKNKKIVV